VQNIKWIAIAIIVVSISILLININCNCNKPKESMQSKLDIEIKKNDSLVTVIEQLKRSRKDSVQTITVYIKGKEKEKDQQQAELQSTQDIDSLITYYKNYRARIDSGRADIKAVDSSTAAIGKEEVKFIAGRFLDLDFVNKIKVAGLENQIGIMGRIIADSDSIITLKDSDIELYKQKVEDLTPGWWDRNKFYIGTTVGTVFGIGVAILLKK
jgi:hypothetical protein